MIYNLVTRVIQYFCFPEKPMKGGDILDFKKGWGMTPHTKGWGMTPHSYPHTNYVHRPPPKILDPPLNLAPTKFIFLFSPLPPNYFGLKFLGPP